MPKLFPMKAFQLVQSKNSPPGNGNASKRAMVEAMKQRGHKPRDDNEADALALLYWRLEQTSLEGATPKDPRTETINEVQQAASY